MEREDKRKLQKDHNSHMQRQCKNWGLNRILIAKSCTHWYSWLLISAPIPLQFLRIMLHSQTSCVCMCWVVSSSFVAQWTVAWQVPLSMKFSRQEYWSELQFPTPVDLTTPGIKPMSLVSSAFAGGVFTTEPPEKPHKQIISLKMLTVLKNSHCFEEHLFFYY